MTAERDRWQADNHAIFNNLMGGDNRRRMSQSITRSQVLAEWDNTMSQYVRKTAIDELQRILASKLRLSAEQVAFHTERENYDEAKEYMVCRAGQVEMVKAVAQALHNVDSKFSKDRFLSETFTLAKIK